MPIRFGCLCILSALVASACGRIGYEQRHPTSRDARTSDASVSDTGATDADRLDADIPPRVRSDAGDEGQVRTGRDAGQDASTSMDGSALDGGGGGGGDASTSMDASAMDSGGGDASTSMDASVMDSGGGDASTSMDASISMDASAMDSGGGDACTETNGGVEICDGIDNDCDGTPDDGLSCGASCRYGTYGGHSYAFCDTGLDWTSAQDDCMAKGMRLVRLDSASENDWVGTTAFADVPDGDNLITVWRWIGGSDLAVDGEWRWTDGEQFWDSTGPGKGSSVGGLYENWAVNSPSAQAGACASMHNDMAKKWENIECPNTQPYVCEAY